MSSKDKEITEERIKALIPQDLAFFSKIKGGEPYRFDRWDFDRNGRYCIYYVVTGGKREYKKRVTMVELLSAVTWFKKEGKFDRGDFRRLCPITHRDGSCGYTVISRILEVLFKTKFVARAKAFSDDEKELNELEDEQAAQDILDILFLEEPEQ